MIQRTRWKRHLVTAAAIAAGTALAVTGAQAASSPVRAAPVKATASMAGMQPGMKMAVGPAYPGRGENDFGMTNAWYNGRSVQFTYSHGFYCDRNISSAATSACEVGAPAKRLPGGSLDPLFITVPLGFTPAKMPDCPVNLTCVDHPMTIDLTRLEKALKPLYPKLTDAQLTAALRNFVTPSHDHFITTTNAGQREWWDVRVIGVTDKKTYDSIRAHHSYAYIQKLLRAHDKHVLGPIPSNLFLLFSVQN